ncbi:TlyA family RNA methyltransferase [Flaviflexus salsibiostraticola]|uniref:TlyA family RNA methyltransferase n=1 Tax=Flaviflexus salsibiostraticola TaxID=1282737 RepID=A0A3S8Z7J3_9ACTO|nr:TlyA family RNA methyltransferase [Flaviflexus salsibiostraticola]AZN29438.1 TlyA family RNA methyltransferase [Flaviflexus salsibiostraticola]
MGRLRRIDAELVRRGLAASRDDAKRLIESGRVRLDGAAVTKPARQVDPAQAIVVDDADLDHYASRGAYKLAGVLDLLGDRAPRIEGRRIIDAGASTGGFTDVLLRRGAAEVLAIDVGYGLLAWRLREDPRVTVMERMNVRELKPEDVAPAPDMAVGDLSFISLTLILPALVAACRQDADFLLMVKPQFEIGKDRLGHGGVVRNLDHHVETVLKVADCAIGLGLDVAAVAASPLPGPAGNVEYFLSMRHDHPDPVRDLPEAVHSAVMNGPAPGLFGRVSPKEGR